MIIFYNKINGEIEGYIKGEKHYKGEESFWIGDKNNGRILYDKTAPYFKEANNCFLLNKEFIVDTESLILKPLTDKL